MTEAVLQNEERITSLHLRDFIELLKPKVMSLVIFTAFAGMVIAPGAGAIHPLLFAVGLLCIAVNAGAAGAINMWVERESDALMKRTQNRPLPQGRIHPDDALAFGIILSLFSVALMGITLNWMAAGLLAFANFFYSYIYSVVLKTRTPQNIVIGGAAGAFPPMIGWAAITGDVTLMPVLLFLIIFLWTPPHFWALALFMNDDYRKAGIPMMPAVKGERRTKIEMLVYTILLLPVAVAPTVFGFTGIIYGIGAFILSGFFVFTSVQTLRDTTHKSAKAMFGYSVFYLFALFGLLILERLIL